MVTNDFCRGSAADDEIHEVMTLSVSVLLDIRDLLVINIKPFLSAS